jgi:hypothetical protein
VFVENTITGELVVMFSFCFGEWYPGFVLFFAFSFVWRGAVLVYVRNTLVSTVGNSVGILFEVYLGGFVQLEVMGFAFGKVCTDHLSCSFIDG